MLYVPNIPSHLTNPYFEYVAKTFADALIYDSVNNPNGLQWLSVVYPFAERVNGKLMGYVQGREYVPIAPDDSFAAMCYFLPSDPLQRVAADSWQFDFDVVFFVNLENIVKTNAPQGRYHVVLMEEANKVIESLVWGFSKELMSAKVINTSEIFAEIEDLNPKYLTAPFAAFRLSYEIQISAACLPPTVPSIQNC
jgi:hypothetical protein